MTDKQKKVATAMGLVLIALGAGHCIYMQYWVYGDVQMGQLTPNKELEIWGRGAILMIFGWVIFKVGTGD